MVCVIKQTYYNNKNNKNGQPNYYSDLISTSYNLIRTSYDLIITVMYYPDLVMKRNRNVVHGGLLRRDD